MIANSEWTAGICTEISPRKITAKKAKFHVGGLLAHGSPNPVRLGRRYAKLELTGNL
jgi:hypothetical protein